MATCPMAGVVSVTTAASAYQLAVVPWLVTPSHTLDVPITVRASLRCGVAAPALMTITDGSS